MEPLGAFLFDLAKRHVQFHNLCMRRTLAEDAEGRRRSPLPGRALDWSDRRKASGLALALRR